MDWAIASAPCSIQWRNILTNEGWRDDRRVVRVSRYGRDGAPSLQLRIDAALTNRKFRSGKEKREQILPTPRAQRNAPAHKALRGNSGNFPQPGAPAFLDS